jgi:hypothetical protein
LALNNIDYRAESDFTPVAGQTLPAQFGLLGSGQQQRPDLAAADPLRGQRSRDFQWKPAPLPALWAQGAGAEIMKRAPAPS